MDVTVNGRAMSVKEGAKVADLLSQLGVDPTRVAVERNHDVVPRRTYTETVLQEGDRLEVVGFVGGG